MNKTPRFQPKFLLLLLGIVCILLVILSTVSPSVNNSVRGVINTVLMPMQKGLNKAGSFVSDSVEDLVSLREVQAENEALQEELAFHAKMADQCYIVHHKQQILASSLKEAEMLDDQGRSE